MRGLGSAYVALERAEDRNAYRDIILWACGRDTAWDAQCEGTRAPYLNDLLCLYDDITPFFEVISRRIDKCTGRYGWEFSQDAWLLSYMAQDGFEPAEEKHRAVHYGLFELLKRRKRFPKNGSFNERDNYILLLITLFYSNLGDRESMKDSFITLAGELGDLYAANPELYSFGNWFYSVAEGI